MFQNLECAKLHMELRPMEGVCRRHWWDWPCSCLNLTSALFLTGSLQDMSPWLFILLFKSTLSCNLLYIYLLMQQQTYPFSSTHILPKYSKIISLILEPLWLLLLGFLSEFHQTSVISTYSIIEVCLNPLAPNGNSPACSLTVIVLASCDY